MKLNFDYIKIENFYSVNLLTYHFIEGVTKVTGVNLDTKKDHSAKASNGAGKSTIFHAISQCLFNRNIKGKTTIDGMYNKVTKKPYYIELGLLVGNLYYIITNNRANNTIIITKDGEDITPKGIKSQLQLIENIIQLDYSTFNILTFLTHKNAGDVLDVTSDKNLLYKFFDLGKLVVLEKSAKLRLRELKKEYAVIINEEKNLIASISEFDKYSLQDLTVLYDKRKHLNNKLTSIKTSQDALDIIDVNNNIKMLNSNLQKEELAKVTTSTTLGNTVKQLHKLENGICPTCNNIVETFTLDELLETKKNLDRNLSIHTKTISKISLEVDKLVKQVAKRKEKLKVLALQYQDDFNIVDKQILVVEERNRNYNKFKEIQDDLIIRREEVVKIKEELNIALNFINPLLQVIKSGEITQMYLINFIKFFNSKLTELSNILDIGIDINAVELSGGIVFEVSKNEVPMEYNLLSSGEQARVALVVLITTILTLEIITNTTINFLVFDELLAVLDSNGLTVFKTLLNTLKQNKNIFVVLHHNEIDDDYFDREFIVTKKDGLSSMEIKE